MFVVFNAKGEIMQTVLGPDPGTYGPILDKAGLAWLFVPELTSLEIWNHYVADGKVVQKPDMPIALDGTVISGIPAGATATILRDGAIQQTATVDDGTLEISSAVPAVYTVAIGLFPYKPWRRDIGAGA